ncbi:MAG: aminotransferase class V-fold PLP-dependent enzyme [Nocardioides sp.]
MVEESREKVAQALNCRPSEIIFTSGGTEADNLAVKGISRARRDTDPARRRILATAVEHHAVLDPLEWLAGQGWDVELLPVDHVGRLEVDALHDSVARDPASVALVPSCGPTTRPARSSRSTRWSPSPPSTASRCTPMPSRRSDRCRSTWRAPGSTR